MKIRQAQTSATYTYPDPGELNKRITLRLRVDTPTDDYGTAPVYPISLNLWAKIVQTSATTLRETAQIDDIVTHYITVRYRKSITADYEVVHGLRVFRVKRGRDLNSAGRYLLLECLELEDAAIPERGGNDGDTLFTR